MHRPRWDESSFLGLRMKGLNEVAGSPVLEGSEQSFFGYASLERQQDLCRIFAAQEIPHLTFAKISGVMNARVIIIRVDLNRKPVAGVNVLGQKGKARVPPSTTVELGAVFLRGLLQGEARTGAVEEPRPFVRNPHLTDQVVRADRRLRVP